ncbi:F-box domain-containing protein [Biscogniauxia sp. FL1348]|nr:F-box domain-containing protein [Biscogniauxia sp. FL1348]
MAENGASQASSSRAAGQDGPGGSSNVQGTEAVESGPKTSVTLNVPNPAVTYGRLNPEIEENVAIVETVSDEGLRGNAADRYNMLSSGGITPLSVDPGSGSNRGTAPHIAAASSSSTNCPSSVNLPSLPSELIASIFSYLSPTELAAVSLVCQSLRNHALADIQWQRHVLSNLPGNQITSPYPCKTWRELYIAHDPHWFLTKHKLWFGDRGLTGQMVIARYDERRGCIEGYQLVATRRRDGSEPWLADQTVHIHYFEPNVKLHLDKPILKFDVDSLDKRRDGSLSRPFFSEKPMHYNRGTDPRFSNFLLAKPLNDISLTTYMSPAFPYGHVWPPPTIPARHRVLGRPHMATEFPVVPSEIWEPVKRSDMSDQTFRIRLWMEMGLPTLGVHVGEEFVTYSTLDPSLYTPTAEKPWRGIWVGDYSGHGCEFLLMNQPNSPREDQQEPLARFENETEEQFQARFQNERVYRGRLEAIKLTGDPNVARGEYTFVADDLGGEGFVGIAEDPPFQGARVVKSRGHIASTGFIDDKYIQSQLILISHNRLAQYWVEFGHISFFERVNIDKFLVPK